MTEGQPHTKPLAGGGRWADPTPDGERADSTPNRTRSISRSPSPPAPFCSERPPGQAEHLSANENNIVFVKCKNGESGRELLERSEDRRLRGRGRRDRVGTGRLSALPPSECSSKAIDGRDLPGTVRRNCGWSAQSGLEDGHQQLISACGASTSGAQSGNRVG
jgi:hypothetical protein